MTWLRPSARPRHIRVLLGRDLPGPLWISCSPRDVHMVLSTPVDGPRRARSERWLQRCFLLLPAPHTACQSRRRPLPLSASLGTPGLVVRSSFYSLPSLFLVCKLSHLTRGGPFTETAFCVLLLCPRQLRALSLSSFVTQRCSIFP